MYIVDFDKVTIKKSLCCQSNNDQLYSIQSDGILQKQGSYSLKLEDKDCVTIGKTETQCCSGEIGLDHIGMEDSAEVQIESLSVNSLVKGIYNLPFVAQYTHT